MLRLPLSFLFQVSQHCYHLTSAEVAVSWDAEDLHLRLREGMMCLLGQPRTQPTPAGKTLVVSPKTRSMARHSWGTQRQETQGRRLSSPRLSQRLLTPLSVLSQEKESMTTSSCQHCSVLQFSPPPHKRFTGFLLRSVLRVGLSCVNIYIFF